MTDQSVFCPGCQNQNTKEILFLNDRRYIGLDRPFSIYQCQNCRLIFIHPVPTENEIQELFENLYRQENPFIPELAFYFAETKSKDHLQAIQDEFDTYLDMIHQVQSPGHILDLGCGEGDFLVEARKRGWTPAGIDSSKEAIQRAKEKYNLDLILGTVESLDFPENQFDTVTLLDFAEHLSRPREILEKIHHWLKPGGIIFIATPNQAGLLTKLAHGIYFLSFKKISSPLYRFYMLPHFLYFTPSTIKDMVQKTGFQIIRLEKTNTDLRRLHLNPIMRIGLSILFGIASIFGLQNRIIVLARKY